MKTMADNEMRLDHILHQDLYLELSQTTCFAGK